MCEVVLIATPAVIFVAYLKGWRIAKTVQEKADQVEQRTKQELDRLHDLVG